jgi:hypothetical protein
VAIAQERSGSDEDADEGLEEVLPRPTSADRPRRASRAPGRPWRDEDLRQLADGFLDGQDDQQLCGSYNRTRAQIKELRAGFECARGNLVEDQISEVAATWVERWRRVLRPQ